MLKQIKLLILRKIFLCVSHPLSLDYERMKLCSLIVLKPLAELIPDLPKKSLQNKSIVLNLCYNFAIKELTLSLAAVLLSMSPIFVIIFAYGHQLLQYHLFKRLYLLHCIGFVHCQKSVGCIYGGLFLCFLFCSSGLFFHRYHTVLFTGALW